MKKNTLTLNISRIIIIIVWLSGFAYELLGFLTDLLFALRLIL